MVLVWWCGSGGGIGGVDGSAGRLDQVLPLHCC